MGQNVAAASDSSFDSMKRSRCDMNVQMIDQMEIMNAVTIFTWHVILLCCFVVAIGVAATRKKQVYYKRIRHCCV